MTTDWLVVTPAGNVVDTIEELVAAIESPFKVHCVTHDGLKYLRLVRGPDAGSALAEALRRFVEAPNA